LLALAKRNPEPPKFIIEDWLPDGYVSLLAGHGGMGKSSISLQLGVCAAAGKPFFGLPVNQRRVMYLSCEDGAQVLHWRLSRICARLSVGLETLAGNLILQDLVGHDCLLDESRPAYTQLVEHTRTFSPGLIIVDSISDVFPGNENDRGEVKRFINKLLALISAPRTGAILLVGHVAKPIGRWAEGYSGSTAWHNSVRARWYLRAETAEADDDAYGAGGVVLELQKSNYGRPQQVLRLRWDCGSHTFAEELATKPRLDREQRDHEERQGILRALSGCAKAEPAVPVPAARSGRNAYGVLVERKEFPASLRGRKKRERDKFWRHIEVLRQSNLVREEDYERTNRHKGTGLVLTEEGVRQCAE
jgi:RecA-family ATPase